MAVFDESGVPVELNQALRKLRTEIEDKRNVIATEKQRIEEIKKQIKEKRGESMKLDSDNQQLEMAIQHTSYIFENQKQQIKMLHDTEELLREQVRNKEEIFEREQENQSKILEECNSKYEEYKEKVQQRMKIYDEIPMVVKLREHMAEVEEMQEAVKTREKQIEELKQDIENRRAKQDPSNLKFKTITEWGVALAKEMIKLRDVQRKTPENLNHIKKSRKEIEELERKKNKVQARPQLPEPTPMECQFSTSAPVEQRREKNKFQLKTMLPSFEGFFKKKPKSSTDQQFGSSGSSLLSSAISSSLPNIPSLFSIPAKSNTTKSTEQLAKPESICMEDNSHENMKQTVAASSPESTLQRSRSLSVLAPQVKPLKKPETLKSTSMLGKSLSDWLKQSPVKPRPKQAKKIEKIVPSLPKVQMAAKKPVSPKKPAIDYEKSTPNWSQPPVTQPAPKVTEVPLIRQIQEKIIQKKVLEQGEQLILEQVQSEQNDVVEEMDDVESVPVPSKEDVSRPKTMLSFFDGPVYDVPMPSVEEEANTKSPISSTSTTPERTSSISTGSTPEMGKAIFEEHRKLLAEFEEMPGDDFRMASNLQYAGGDALSFLVGQKTPSPETKKNEFEFAVPTLPGTSLKKKSKSPESQFFLGFGGQSSDRQGTSSASDEVEYGNFSKSRSSPTSFSFGATEEPSSSAGLPFSFGAGFGSFQENSSTNKSPVKGNKSPNPSFSFGNMFSEGTSPSSDDGMFSFNFGGNSSPKEDQNLFSFNAPEKEQPSSSEFLFSSAFGCQK